jgi:hypothetical protein
MAIRKLRNGTKEYIDDRDAEVEAKLVNIYADINQIWLDSLRQHYTDRNPYSEFRSWGLKRFIRYTAADESLGREYLAIAMASLTFFVCMADDDEEAWKDLLARVNENRDSLKMFAVTRNVPFVRHYDSSPWPRLIGSLPAHCYERPLSLQPHEVYLSKSGLIKRLKINGRKVKDVSESFYDADKFKEYPRYEKWPLSWIYPRNPTHSAPTDEGKFPDCWKCKRTMGPTHPGPSQPRWVVHPFKACECTTSDVFTYPIVEIIEYPPMPNDPNTINRGIRALSVIKKDYILGEYVGDIIPKQAQDDVGDDSYAFDLYGPRTNASEENEAEEGEEEEETKFDDDDDLGESIAIVSACYNGNWTRFMNHKGMGKNNVQFVTKSIGYKTRILAVARRNIAFGEELTVSYGEEYFKEMTMSNR